jgi:integrase
MNSILELFGTIYNFGLKEDLYTRANPSLRVERFEVNNTRERYLYTNDISLLFDTLKDNKLLTLFVQIALTTGARLESIISIQKKDLDLYNGLISLNDFKSKGTYKGFLTDELIQIFADETKELRANDYVININKQQVTSRQIQQRLKPILDKLFNKQIDRDDRKNRVVIHTLRHTFASHLAINETPIYTIQKLMNHKDIKMTLRYAKLAPESGKSAIQGLYK